MDDIRLPGMWGWYKKCQIRSCGEIDKKTDG